MKKNNWIDKKTEGIEKYFHPIFNQHTMYSPNRNANVFIQSHNIQPVSVPDSAYDELFCLFCLGNIHSATPDKYIAISDETQIPIFISYPDFEEKTQNIIFRQQGNLFEILDYGYWTKTYGLQPSEQSLEQIETAFHNPIKKDILTKLVEQKLSRINQEINSYTEEQIKTMCLPFYEGFHELLTSGRHYSNNPQFPSDLFHSGKISWQEHRIAFTMICKIIKDMRARNPYIQFITIFQNWLTKAGASFEHWHKQLLGIDFWGQILTNEAKIFKNQPTFYQDFILETGLQEKLFIAENKHALAYVEIGGKSGQITICSKSANLNPVDHSTEEIQAMSDLTHAVLSVFTPLTPYNEEWFYTPFNQTEFKTPWRIIINIRSNTIAGFENITDIYINPISPSVLAHQVRELLTQNQTHIAPDIIIDPKIKQNTLLYI